MERASGVPGARSASSDATAWDNAYEGTPTWDIGRPQGAVIRLIASGAIGGAVLDAGCGTGEHALLLAAAGHRVTGIDLSPRAIDKAAAKAAGRGLDVSFAVRDACALDAADGMALGGPFDTALDVGLFHSLQPDDRRRYARSLAALVRPGGRAFLVSWSSRNPFGYGPQRIDRSMIRRSFIAAGGWAVASIESEELETRLPDGRVHAWLATLRRR